MFTDQGDTVNVSNLAFYITRGIAVQSLIYSFVM